MYLLKLRSEKQKIVSENVCLGEIPITEAGFTSALGETPRVSLSCPPKLAKVFYNLLSEPDMMHDIFISSYFIY